MKQIVFFDFEVSKSGKILDIGAVNQNGATFHSSILGDFIEFISKKIFTASKHQHSNQDNSNNLSHKFMLIYLTSLHFDFSSIRQIYKI